MESLFTYPHDYEHAPANVFAGHAIFNATEAERLMPKDTLYIASVRNPLTHITSVLEEFDTVNFPMVQQTKWSNLTEYFLDNLEKYGPSMRMPTKSLMAQMFGVPDKDLDNLEVIDRALEYIDKQFALVIVMEYFDESLIVLRRKLCWEMADIVYLSQRVSHRPRDPVSDKNEEKYREWSYADFLIHHHFADKLWAQEIPKHSDFWDELHTLRKINKMITDYCKTVLEEFMTHDPYFILSTVRFLRETNYLALDPRPWGNPFYIRPADCVVMSLDTSVMRNIFKVRQIPKLCTLNNTQRIVPDSIISDIDWVGDKVELHPDYCLPPHPDYGFPLEILASKEAYLEPALIYWSWCICYLELVILKIITWIYIVWNYLQLNASSPYWLLVNIDSGNGLVPPGNKPFPE